MSTIDDVEHDDGEEGGAEEVSTLEGDAGTTARSISYEDVNIDLTAGYKPTIVVSLVVAASFVLLGGVVPGLDGGGGGMTAMTYTVVVWGFIVGVLGFVYEYWIGRNQATAGTDRAGR